MARTFITTRIETVDEIVERKAQEFYEKFGRRPYGLTLKFTAEQVARDFT